MADEKHQDTQQSPSQISGNPIQKEQPKPTPMMHPSGSGLGGNRNALNKPVNKDGKREWSHGLFSFTEACGTCCLAWFCPCAVYGENLTRREHMMQHGRPHPMGGDSCAGDAWLHCCLSWWCCGMGVCLQISSRGDTRERYHIEGNTCSDCFASCLCTPCALTQEAREIELEENSLFARRK